MWRLPEPYMFVGGKKSLFFCYFFNCCDVDGRTQSVCSLKVETNLSLSVSWKNLQTAYICLPFSVAKTPSFQLHHLHFDLFWCPLTYFIPLRFVELLHLSICFSILSPSFLPTVHSCSSPFISLPFPFFLYFPCLPSSSFVSHLGLCCVWSIRSPRQLSVPCRQPLETLTIWEELSPCSICLLLFPFHFFSLFPKHLHIHSL